MTRSADTVVAHDDFLSVVVFWTLEQTLPVEQNSRLVHTGRAMCRVKAFFTRLNAWLAETGVVDLGLCRLVVVSVQLGGIDLVFPAKRAAHQTSGLVSFVTQ